MDSKLHIECEASHWLDKKDKKYFFVLGLQVTVQLSVLFELSTWKCLIYNKRSYY